MKRFKAFIFKMRLRMAIRTADREAKLFNKKMLVIAFAGKPKVFEKQKLKQLIKRGFFVKGVTIERLEKMAYYITK